MGESKTDTNMGHFALFGPWERPGIIFSIICQLRLVPAAHLNWNKMVLKPWCGNFPLVLRKVKHFETKDIWQIEKEWKASF